MARVLSSKKPAKKGQISWHIPPFEMFLFFEEGKRSRASAAPKPLQRHCDCPPYCVMKQITARGSAKAEYATIDCNKIDRLRNRAKKRLASDLRENRKARRSGYARRELQDCAQCNDNRSYRQRYNNDGDDDRNYCNRDRGGCRLG